MKKRLVGLAAVYMFFPAMLLAQPTGKKQLVGVWAVKEAPVEQSQSPLLSLAMFGGDGSFTAGVGYKALPPIPVVQDVATEVGPGYGRWAATGDKGFRLTFYAVMRKAGEGAGFQRVQETLVLSDSGDEYTGHAQVDFLDADWNVVFSTTSEEKATRLETPMPATLSAQPAERKGVWEDKIEQIEQGAPPILGLILSREDGTWSEDKGTPPSPAKGVAYEQYSPGYGRLVKTGDREYRLVFYYVLLKAGLVNGFNRVQSNEVSPESGDEFTAQANWATFDANWNVLINGSGGATGTRLETPGQD